MEKTTIKELINLLEQELIRMGYKESTLHYYRENWKRLIAYFDEHGEQFFCEKTAMQYVDEKCDFFAKEKAGLLTQSNIYLLRIVRMIGDFQEHGAVLRRYQRSLSKIKKTENMNLLNDFKEHCKAADYSASTQKSYCRTAENFLSFMEAHDTNVKKMTAKNLAAFVKTLMGYSYKTVEFVLCGTRAFLRFLYGRKALTTDLSDSLPRMQARKQTRIPSVWNKEDLLKLTRGGVSHILQKYAALASEKYPNMPEIVTPHTIRHSKAMHLYQAGVNLIYIRDILGHADISTTDIYARADTESKRKELERAFPDITGTP